jgi:hypothetical protein
MQIWLNFKFVVWRVLGVLWMTAVTRESGYKSNRIVRKAVTN